MGIKTPWTPIIFIRSPQLTSLLPRGETLFHFTLIKISEQNRHHWSYCRTKFSSSKFFSSSKLFWDNTCLSRKSPSAEPTYSLSIYRFAHQMILLAPGQNCKDMHLHGYKTSVHVHNIHSLATIHLLISTRQNSSRPPPQFLFSLTWILLYQSPASKHEIFTIDQHPPEESELQLNSSTSMMVSVSLAFRLLAE